MEQARGAGQKAVQEQRPAPHPTKAVQFPESNRVLPTEEEAHRHPVEEAVPHQPEKREAAEGQTQGVLPDAMPAAGLPQGVLVAAQQPALAGPGGPGVARQNHYARQVPRGEEAQTWVSATEPRQRSEQGKRVGKAGSPPLVAGVQAYHRICRTWQCH